MEESYISISFSGLIKVLKKEKWVFLAVIFLVTLGGLLYALKLKDEFTSSGKILPEIKGSGGKASGLSGLASLAGVSIPSDGSEAYRPELYPDVLQSTPFYLFLLKQNVTDQAKKSRPLSQYLKEAFKYERSKKAIDLVDLKNGSVSLSAEDFALIKILKPRISAAMDRKTGVITVSSKMQDRYVAASITTLALNYLTNYISEYRTKKAKENLVFFEEQMMKAKHKYYTTQAQKAQYSDNFMQQYMRSKSMDIQRERIETEYMFSSAFYKQLEQQYEQAKIDLQRELPVIQILEPPLVPNIKSEPSRSIIVAGSMLLGIFLALVVILVYKKNYQQVLVKES